MTTEPDRRELAELTDAEQQAAVEGRVRECPYNHPRGTRCPNCSKWPFKKGGAAVFIEAVRAALRATEKSHD